MALPAKKRHSAPPLAKKRLSSASARKRSFVSYRTSALKPRRRATFSHVEVSPVSSQTSSTQLSSSQPSSSSSSGSSPFPRAARADDSGFSEKLVKDVLKELKHSSFMTSDRDQLYDQLQDELSAAYDRVVAETKRISLNQEALKETIMSMQRLAVTAVASFHEKKEAIAKRNQSKEKQMHVLVARLHAAHEEMNANRDRVRHELADKKSVFDQKVAALRQAFEAEAEVYQLEMREAGKKSSSKKR